MTWSHDEFKALLDKYDVEYREDSEVIGDREYVGVRITGGWMKLPREIRHSLYSELPEDHLRIVESNDAEA
jgi:hypothetical protein